MLNESYEDKSDIKTFLSMHNVLSKIEISYQSNRHCVSQRVIPCRSEKQCTCDTITSV